MVQPSLSLLVLRAEDLERSVQALADLDVVILAAPAHSSTGSRAVIQDPDGRAIEIHERT